ncbi:hypothetical protein STCU_09353 [Strigomonas culicis]|nr:hypothetical protein STCU_09353 [Strigomonas culicis]|eukprot:EPY19643.1 hypothetical protein STCU_09353 [Strigomonas culicis]
MATKGGSTVGAVLEKRYNTLKALPAKTPEEEEELDTFGDGPAANLAVGSEARIKWFSDFFQDLCSAQAAGSQNENMERFQYLQQHVGLPISLLMSLMSEQEQQPPQ